MLANVPSSAIIVSAVGHRSRKGTAKSREEWALCVYKCTECVRRPLNLNYGRNRAVSGVNDVGVGPWATKRLHLGIHEAVFIFGYWVWY